MCIAGGCCACNIIIRSVIYQRAALLVLIGALHGSLQHELLHGHPTRFTWLNGALGYVPIALLFPYSIYRREHIAHHNNATLTLPGIDPESYYVSRDTWISSGPFARAYYLFRMTLLGRLLCGPAHTAVSLSRTLLNDMIVGSMLQRSAWLSHLSLVGLTLYWVDMYWQIPVWHYLLIAYLANSLSMVRSFFEHRAVPDAQKRSVIVETGWFFRLLFLNNNYHLTHHENPGVPWYQLGALYHAGRTVFLNQNGHYIYHGYRHWLLGHLLKPVDSPLHPFADTDDN